jgi:mRNA interferase MazF
MTWADAPGSTRLSARATSLPRDSVANASRIITIDRSFLDERVGRLAPKHLVQILHGMNVVLGR